MQDKNLLFSSKVMFMLTESPDTNSRSKTNFSYDNANLLEGLKFTEDNNFPIIEKYTGPTDFELVSFTDKNRFSGNNQAVHFFLDDTKFRYAVWDRLEFNTRRIAKFDYVFTPDWSLYVNHQLHFLNKRNLYRTRLAGAFWQKCGLNVIPTASWGNADSFKYCFEGLPEESVIAVCGVGHSKNWATKKLWTYAIRQLEAQKHPIKILVYGPETEIVGLTTPVQFFPDFITKNFRNNESGIQ